MVPHIHVELDCDACVGFEKPQNLKHREATTKVIAEARCLEIDELGLIDIDDLLDSASVGGGDLRADLVGHVLG